MTFADDLAKAKTAKAPHEDVPVLIGGTAHTLRFKQMLGSDWASETDNHPLRPGVLIDMRYGYNIRSLTEAAARLSGVRVENGREIALQVEEADGEGVSAVDEWADVFAAVSGHDFMRITDAIWGLNQYEPEQAIEKAMARVKKPQDRLPKRSGSPSS